MKSLPRNYAIEQILARVNDFDLCEIHERPKEIRELYRHIDFHEFREFLLELMLRLPISQKRSVS